MKILICLLAFLLGCTHDYHGRQPDFHREGAAAKAEYDQFKIYSMHHTRTTLGRENGIRTRSLNHLIKDVSPDAYNQYRKMELQRTVHSGLTAIMWITVGVLALSTDMPSFYALGAVGIVFGHTLYMDGRYHEIKNQYNQDLKHRLDQQKVAPHLGYNWKF